MARSAFSVAGSGSTFSFCSIWFRRSSWRVVLRLGSPVLDLLGSVSVWGGGVGSCSSALVSRCRRSLLLHLVWTSMVFSPQGVRGLASSGGVI